MKREFPRDSLALESFKYTHYQPLVLAVIEANVRLWERCWQQRNALTVVQEPPVPASRHPAVVFLCLTLNTPARVPSASGIYLCVYVHGPRELGKFYIYDMLVQKLPILCSI